MRAHLSTALWLCLAGVSFAQPVLEEAVDFPRVRPGPGAIQSGSGCFHLAHGSIFPGDVDWVQITLPRATTQTVVDIDFPTGTAGSALLASVVGGTTAFNMGDNNNSRDALCGLSAATFPVGSTRDSAANLNATARNIVINIGITGAADSGFTGAHTESFDYDVWVYANTLPCTSNGDCNDSVACTTDVCLVSTGLCTNTADDSRCDNGLYCDGDEFCDGARGCRMGAVPECDDDVECTVDDCDEAGNRCVHTADDAYCNDEIFCNGVERCDPRLDCQDGTPPRCDDGVGCTWDSCDSETDACMNRIDHSLCDDGRACNGEESCDAEFDCQPGEALDCDDGVDCTVDRCDDNVDACVYTANDSLCDDGLFCNGSEACDAARGCLAGTPPNCSDGVGCTADSCDAALDDCVNVADDARCDNGLFCDGAETCDARGGCQGGTAPCGDGPCREADDRCVECSAAAECDDEDFCNGPETCREGACVAGQPPCPEGFSCNPETRECTSGQYTLDARPRACPNRFPGSGQDHFPFAVTGGEGADVRRIDPKSLRLSRVDGVGKVLPLASGNGGPRPAVHDVSTPFDGPACGCHVAGGDGYDDLVVQFSAELMKKKLKLDSRGVVTLRLSGFLRDGTPFEVTDCVTVEGPKGKQDRR